MKKLATALLVSGLVMTGVGYNHAEAASGNSIQTVQQLTQGQKTLENVTIGESIKNVINHYGTPIYLSLIHISEPTRLHKVSRMPSSA